MLSLTFSYGESTINDAVSIVMYNTFSKLLLSPMSFTTLLIAGLDIIGMTIGSTVGSFPLLHCSSSEPLSLWSVR